ncbi:MAG: 30S ribosome-binding factor RbfA [Clostridia bacterium]|nr:30S ribosome-binding factor RbfA [Clostridia bacterium]
MPNSNRMNRVNSEIQKTLAKIISRFDDKEISTSLISIMKVETFADFSLSKIYVSVFGDEEKKNSVVAKLNHNKKQIRYDLAHSLKMRIVPDLIFIVDEFEEKSERVLKLFQKIEEETDAK